MLMPLKQQNVKLGSVEETHDLNSLSITLTLHMITD